MNLLLYMDLILVLRNVLMKSILHLDALLFQKLNLLLKELYPLGLLIEHKLLILKHDVHCLVVSLKLVFVSEVLNELLDFAYFY